jgi:hypothetical protein
MQSGFRVDEIAHQWHDLAERRLAYYRELYRSGRWKHYYRTRELFAERMFDVIKSAKAFRKLTGKPAAPSARQTSTSKPSARPDDSRTAA